MKKTRGRKSLETVSLSRLKSSDGSLACHANWSADDNGHSKKHIKQEKGDQFAIFFADNFFFLGWLVL
jgi:hypothetical protein